MTKFIKDSANEIAAEVVRRPAEEWLREQYLLYTLYTLRERALVAEDGLKPVNRRILFSLFQNGITPNSSTQKAAIAAGNAMTYHPHGNKSIEDALGRMAQWHSTRVPLVEVQGQVGFAPGDVPAASRYWECRLNKAAMELLREIPEGAVAMGKNFTGEYDEPRLLPIRWPCNVINGDFGIAVGHSSTTAPHNPDEVMKATIALLKNPNLTVDQLLKIMPGPDFPTGAEVIGTDGIREYYETGKGSVRIRSRYNVEQLPRGRARITFYELPFRTPVSSVLDKLHKLQAAGNLKEITLARDLTDGTKGVRLIMETRSGSNIQKVINELFRSTPLEQSFSVNNTTLVESMPRQLSMLQLLGNFIEFRRLCITNKSNRRMEKIDARIFRLDGLLSALVDIDKCIAIIRKADSAEQARANLVKAFKIADEQADYILSMQLRQLTRADSIQLKNERAELEEEKKRLSAILSDPAALEAEMEAELISTMKIISDKRRSVILGLTNEQAKAAAKNEAQVARDGNKNLSCTITRFVNGELMLSHEEFAYGAKERKLAHGPIAEQIKLKTQENVIVVLSDGQAHKVPLSYFSEGTPMQKDDLGISGNAEIVAIAKDTALKTDVGLMLASKKGEVKIVRHSEWPNKDEFSVFALAEGDEILTGRWLGRTLTKSHFVSITRGNNVLVYDATTIRPTGVPAGGVRSHKLVDSDDEVISFTWVANVKDPAAVIVSQSELSVKLTSLAEIPPKGKATQGVALHRFKKGESKLVSAYAGIDAVIVNAKTMSVIANPVLTKRAAAGAELNVKTVMGLRSTVVM